MKRLLTLLLSAAVAATLFAGCSGGEDNPPKGQLPEGAKQVFPSTSQSSSAAEDTSSSVQSTDEEKVLNIFTWDGYFPEDVIAEYTERTGIKVNFSNFESNEEMLTKLEAANAGDYDIIVASDYIIDIMRKKGGLLKELDKSQIPNFSNIDPNFQSKFYDPDNLYTVPYGPGTPLIVYDPEVCTVDIQGYEDLWNPELADSIVAMDDARNLIGITLKSMGKSFNETDPAVLEQAKEKLLQLKPNIRTLAVNNLQDVILSGEASVGYMFTAQVVMALQQNPNLKVVYPKEGMGFGIDNLIVPANAPHPNNAFGFLNYILEPEVGAKVSSQIMYMCPNQASAEYLPEEFKNNQALYIPSDVLGNTEFIQDVGEATEIYDKIWTEFKQQ